VEVQILLKNTFFAALVWRMKESVERFMKRGWSFQKHNSKGRQAYRIFSASRRNKDEEHDKLRASASELLSMYTLLRLWAETEIGDKAEVALERSSFDASCSVIDAILMAKRQLLTMPDAGRLLKRRVTNFMQRHKRAYGTAHVRPKHHWMFDVAEQFLIDPQVFDQFIIERLHLTVKLHADRCDNTFRYERSVLSGVLNSQIAALRLMKGDCCLLDCQTGTLPGFDHAVVGDNMDCFGMHLSVDDIVTHNQTMGRICACVSELDMFLVIVEPLRLVAYRSSGGGTNVYGYARLHASFGCSSRSKHAKTVKWSKHKRLCLCPNRRRDFRLRHS